MASRKLILSSSLRLSSSSPYGYLFNRVTEYSSAAAAAPPQTPHEHEHIKGVGRRCKCIPMSKVIAIHKRKTGRDDIDMDYIVAQANRDIQLNKEIYRKADELKKKEFGSNRKKNDKLLREMITKMYDDYDNNNK